MIIEIEIFIEKFLCPKSVYRLNVNLWNFSNWKWNYASFGTSKWENFKLSLPDCDTVHLHSARMMYGDAEHANIIANRLALHNSNKAAVIRLSNLGAWV